MTSSTSSHLPVLTTLCSICYTNPPKYRCPRCSMRTCSVECSKTHKIRASCSGIREPAKYIPRREMKASTIDMDYNFLQKVKKTREVGKSEIQKLNNDAPKTRRRKLAWAKRESAISKACKQGIRLRGLPSWMERFKTNKLRWDKSYSSVHAWTNPRLEMLLWTVEWVVNVAEEPKIFVDHEYLNLLTPY